MLSTQGLRVYLLFLCFGTREAIAVHQAPRTLAGSYSKRLLWCKASGEGVRGTADQRGHRRSLSTAALPCPVSRPSFDWPGGLAASLSHVDVDLMVVISQCPGRERLGSRCPPLPLSVLSDAFDEGTEGSLANRPGY